jgi:hypothetical protein
VLGAQNTFDIIMWLHFREYLQERSRIEKLHLRLFRVYPDRLAGDMLCLPGRGPTHYTITYAYSDKYTNS